VLSARKASATVLAYATGLRNFWMADPDQISALVAAALISEGDPSKTAMYHIVGGNDQLVKALAASAPKCDIEQRHIVRSVKQTDRGVRVTVVTPQGRIAQAEADYVVIAVPVALLGDIEFSPLLPAAQRKAFDSLDTGPGTKVLLRFRRPSWRRPGRPRAYGSNLATGAVWDAGEDQRGAALLALLAGGRASDRLQRLLDKEGASGLARQLRWFTGDTGEVPSVHAVNWARDPWARGAYAYFGPRFDPGFRPLLARAFGRIFFAGCHTSREYQGYMNGAVESGVRVAKELEAVHTI
jgi:monoamine oxidase